MGKQTRGPLPAEVEALRLQLQEWRLTRKGSCPIPAPIWDAAVPLAIRFGVCRIGRAVGLDYTWLRKKVARANGASSTGDTAFLELPAEMVLPTPHRARGAGRIPAGSQRPWRWSGSPNRTAPSSGCGSKARPWMLRES
jgi:hypothetical protein